MKEFCEGSGRSVLLRVMGGVIAGGISGMGMGGGAVLIPMLVVLLGIEQTVAQGINLLYFLPTALLSCFVHLKGGRVELGLTLRVVAFGIIGAIFGAYLGLNIQPDTLRKIFAVFLLVMGAAEIRSGFKYGKAE